MKKNTAKLTAVMTIAAIFGSNASFAQQGWMNYVMDYAKDVAGKVQNLAKDAKEAAVQTPVRKIAEPKQSMLEYDLKVTVINQSSRMHLNVAANLPAQPYFLEGLNELRSATCKAWYQEDMDLRAEGSVRLRTVPASRIDRDCEYETSQIRGQLLNVNRLVTHGEAREVTKNLKVLVGQNRDDETNFATRISIGFEGGMKSHYRYSGNSLRHLPTGTFTYVGAELSKQNLKDGLSQEHLGYEQGQDYRELVWNKVSKTGRNIELHFEQNKIGVVQNQDFEIIVEKSMNDADRKAELKVTIRDIPTVNVKRI